MSRTWPRLPPHRPRQLRQPRPPSRPRLPPHQPWPPSRPRWPSRPRQLHESQSPPHRPRLPRPARRTSRALLQSESEVWTRPGLRVPEPRTQSRPRQPRRAPRQSRRAPLPHCWAATGEGSDAEEQSDAEEERFADQIRDLRDHLRHLADAESTSIASATVASASVASAWSSPQDDGISIPDSEEQPAQVDSEGNAGNVSAQAAVLLDAAAVLLDAAAVLLDAAAGGWAPLRPNGYKTQLFKFHWYGRHGCNKGAGECDFIHGESVP
mmetsp:Transcript_2501/g.7031  ORF Transcript_2501/g.7031 Transcript_2501/m.7031 type:complete len:267 (+) Transcript_2501:513-1313(+)